MMARRGAIGLLAGGVSALLGGCGRSAGGHSYRFRLTVEVDTPEGSRSGSSVYAVSAGAVPALLPDERKRDWTLTGEAVHVPLPNGRALFSLLRTRHPLRHDLGVVSMGALDPGFRNDVVESVERIAAREGAHQSAHLPRSDYPVLVVFEDVLDKASVRQVDPANIESVLGPGYAIRDITVELTEQQVTTGLKNILPWVPNQQGALLQISIADYPPAGTPLPVAANLTERDFSQGIS